MSKQFKIFGAIKPINHKQYSYVRFYTAIVENTAEEMISFKISAI